MPNSSDFIATTSTIGQARRSNLLGIRKRSVSLGGHRTSVSLEQAFWDELSRIARSRNQSTNALVAEIDRQRSAAGAGGDGAANLSSAVRLFVLAELRRAAGVDAHESSTTTQ